MRGGMRRQSKTREFYLKTSDVQTNGLVSVMTHASQEEIKRRHSQYELSLSLCKTKNTMTDRNQVLKDGTTSSIAMNVWDRCHIVEDRGEGLSPIIIIIIIIIITI
eukprot:scaffold10861_cov180-Amphora_coffeaeformis.AAC.10